MISKRISDDIIRQYTSLNENFEYGYPHSNVLLQRSSKIGALQAPGKLHESVCHQMKCGVINDVKLFPTVYRRIYCCDILSQMFDDIQSDVALQKQVQ